MAQQTFSIVIPFFDNYVCWIYHDLVFKGSRVAQRKRAGPITQRSENRNLALLELCT